MNIPMLWKTVSRGFYQAITKAPQQRFDTSSLTRGMHCICSNNKTFDISSRITPSIVQPSEFLRVKTTSIIPSCGMKVRGIPKLRCKDCYFVVRQERLYVFCKSKPRHKQMSVKSDDKKSWMLSHATQGKQRGW